MSTLSLWTRRDPFAEFDGLARSFFGPMATPPRGFVPAAELTRDGEDAVVKLELPGLDVDKDVTVELERGRLVVRGERRDERTDERTDDRGGKTLREVRYGSFRRTFGLPAHVTADAISASYDAGVLTVRVSGAYAGTSAQRIAIAGSTEGAPALETSEGTAA